jgi:hypothetical protein
VYVAFLRKCGIVLAEGSSCGIHDASLKAFQTGVMNAAATAFGAPSRKKSDVHLFLPR